MNKLLLLFVLFLPALVPSAEIVENLDIRLPDNSLQKGMPLVIEVSYDRASDVTLRGWQVFGYEPDLPAGMKMGQMVWLHPSSMKKWNCYYLGLEENHVTNWLGKKQWDKTSHVFVLDTVGWPAGDYKTGMSLVFDNRGKQTIVKKQVLFSISDKPRLTDAAEIFQNSEWKSNFNSLFKDKKVEAQTRFKITSDDDSIYLKIEALEPHMEKLHLKKLKRLFC